MSWWFILIVYVGYVGFTVAVTTGTVFDGLRDWLKSFSHPWNPLPMIGKLLGCSMCFGFWVGVVGDAFHPFYHGNEWWIRVAVHVASGGLVSLSAYFIDLALRWVESVVVDREVQNEFVRERIEAGGEDKPATDEGPDMVAGGEPAIGGGAGDHRPRQ
jgi:hypothetical protein